MIPISLYMNLDVVRVMQTIHIVRDGLMEYNQMYAQVKSSGIHDDMGQVNFILTDKTGTITDNQMTLNVISIDGVVYGSVKNEEEKTRRTLKVPVQSSTANMWWQKNQEDNVEVLFEDLQLHPSHNATFDSLNMKDELTNRNKRVVDFTECMMLCHNSERGTSKVKNNFYYLQSTSTDDEALLLGMFNVGCLLYERTDSIISYYSPAVERIVSHTILAIHPFNSDRKRMSILVQAEGGTSKLFIKGADTSIVPRISFGQDEDYEQKINELQKQISSFATRGLRTLVCAQKKLTSAETKEYMNLRTNASIGVVNRESRLLEIAETIENDFEVLGITGIEDKIQSGVEETIYALRLSGITIWMLTGDSTETAISVAHTAKLLDESFTVYNFSITASTHEETRKMIEREYDRYQATLQETTKVAFVTNGQALSLMFSDDELLEKLITIGCRAQVCLACRTSPGQKAALAKLVKTKFAPPPLTLAIGDGGNDVGMIKEAHLGVGILGTEGNQAAGAADYAIARFNFLLRLLHVHGRWNYNRVTFIALYSIYKNVNLSSIQFFYFFISGVSGTSFFDSWLMMSYNVIWTFLPTLFFGFQHEDRDDTELYEFPEIYLPRNLRKFCFPIFTRWIIEGLVGAYITFLIGQVSLPDEDIVLSGTIMFIIIGIISTIRIVNRMTNRTKEFIFSVFVSFAAGFFSIFVIATGSFATDRSSSGLGLRFFYPAFMITPRAWLNILLSATVFSLVDACFNHFMTQIFPNELEILAFGDSKPSIFLKRIFTCNWEFRYESGWVTYGKKKVLDVNAKWRRARPKIIASLISDFKGRFVHKIQKYKFVRRLIRRMQERSRDMNTYTLSFKNVILEDDFRKSMKRMEIRTFRMFLLVFAPAFMLYYVIYIIMEELPVSLMMVVRSLGVPFTSFCIAFITFKFEDWYCKYFYHLNQIIMTGVLSLKIYSDVIDDYRDNALTIAILPIVFLYLLRFLWTYMVQSSIFTFLVFLFRYSLLSSKNVVLAEPDQTRVCQFENDNFCSLVDYLPYTVCILFSTLWTAYVREQALRKKFLNQQRALEQTNRMHRLLCNLLPEFVVHQFEAQQQMSIMEKEETILQVASKHTLLTIIFMDVINFEMLALNCEPYETVLVLDYIFRQMDSLTAENSVTKVETVGSTFLACSGLRQNCKRDDSAKSEVACKYAAQALSLALGVMKDNLLCKALNLIGLKLEDVGEDLCLKIGINSGPVISGLVGTRKPQYACFGDTVNTSARIKAKSQPNGIHLSSKAFRLVNGNHPAAEYFEERQVQAKGKGTMDTFLLTQENQLRYFADQSGENAVEDPAQSRLASLEDQMPVIKLKTEMEIQTDNLDEDNDSSGQAKWALDFHSMLTFRGTLKDVNFEAEFLQGFYEKQSRERKSLQLNLVIQFLGYLLTTLTIRLIDQNNPIDVDKVATIRATVTACLILNFVLYTFIPRNHLKHAHALYVLTALYGYAVTLIAPFHASEERPWLSYMISLEFLYWIIIIQTQTLKNLTQLVILDLFIIIITASVFFYQYQTYGGNIMYYVENLFFAVAIIFITLGSRRVTDSWERTGFMYAKLVDKLENRCGQLIAEMLPKKFVTDLLESRPRISHMRHDVCLFFADIAGFTKYSDNVAASEVVKLVTTLFSKVDQISRLMKVYKICTIGDCYVATTEMNDYEDGEEYLTLKEQRLGVKKLIDFAYAVICCIESMPFLVANDIKMRVGMHIGDFVAGVIGKTTLRYDIWGPDVILANDVEANGILNRILISEHLRTYCEETQIACPSKKHKLIKFQERYIQTHLLKRMKIQMVEKGDIDCQSV